MGIFVETQIHRFVIDPLPVYSPQTLRRSRGMSQIPSPSTLHRLSGDHEECHRSQALVLSTDSPGIQRNVTDPKPQYSPQTPRGSRGMSPIPSPSTLHRLSGDPQICQRSQALVLSTDSPGIQRYVVDPKPQYSPQTLRGSRDMSYSRSQALVLSTDSQEIPRKVTDPKPQYSPQTLRGS